MKTEKHIKQRLENYLKLVQTINATTYYAQYRRLLHKIGELCWILGIEPPNSIERKLEKE